MRRRRRQGGGPSATRRTAYPGCARGAPTHLVRPSRDGARMRPTIARAAPGRRSHSPDARAGHTVWARRTATIPGTPWGVGHGPMDGQAACPGAHGRSWASIRTPATSRVTTIIRPAGPDRGTAGLIVRAPPIDRLPANGRRSRFRPIAGQSSEPKILDHSRTCRSRSRRWRSVSRRRRTTPRRSRSSRMTRAAATSPGSRVIVEAIQSMYDGSKAAISPRVWPRNLPNATSIARAASKSGGSGATNDRARERRSGPVGSEARGGSRSMTMVRGGDCPGSRALRCGRTVVGRFRGWNVSVVSTRRVTGRVGRARGGPDGGRTVDPAHGSSVAAGPRRAACAETGVGASRSASYAALIWAIRRVAARAIAGSAPTTSGWCSRARRRQAALIVVWLASRATPRTSRGSLSGIVRSLPARA